jgi:hypothetical protein
MGTNYYLTEQANICEHCGRGDVVDELHIGKSSGGWAFALRVHPDEDINSLDDWVRRWEQPLAVIKDGYGKTVSAAEMLDVITNREGNAEDGRKPMNYATWADFHRANYSYRGPHNLLFSTFDIVYSGETYQTRDREF